MQLEFGSGQAAAVLNLSTVEVEMYNRRDEEGLSGFHARFGGRQHYVSLSGLSGAGYIPDRADVRPVGVMRTDVSRPQVPDPTPTLPGVRLVVLTKHLEREVGVLLMIRGREVSIIQEHQLQDALLGTLELERTQEVKLTSWVQVPHDRMVERKLDITVRWDWKPRRFGKLSLRRVLELLFWNELFQEGAATIWSRSHEPFYERLGLHRSEVDGRLYRSVGGILRYPVEDTVSALAAETGQRIWAGLGQDGNVLARVAEWEDEEHPFILHHSGEEGRSDEGVALTLEKALEMFSSAETPQWLKDLLREVRPAYGRELGDGLAAWERDLLAAE